MIVSTRIKHCFVLILSCVLSSYSIAAMNDGSQKKRLLILSSIGGGGHTTVCRALDAYLGASYDLKVVNVFRDVLGPYDFIKVMTRGYFNGEDLYNFCLRRSWVSAIGLMLNWGSWYIYSRSQIFSTRVYDFIKAENPDMIISVVPIVNGLIMPVAEALDLPFLVLTNDLDTSNYLRGFDATDYKKFYYTLTADDELLTQLVHQRGIAQRHIRTVGFPLRPDFYRTERDHDAICKDFEVDTSKKVVMLLMGGAGSVSSYHYVSCLAKLHYPIHVIVCLGSNEALRSRIESIPLPPYMSLTIVGYTNRIADLMSISDLLITKSGPGSVMEALTLGVPLLIDGTKDILPWEQMNIDFVLKHKCGAVITEEAELSDLLYRNLVDEKYMQKMRKNLISFRKNLVCFDTQINDLVSEILENANV